MDEGWEETNDIYCYREKFDLRCVHCGHDMLLRHSLIYLKKNELPLDLRSYKCKKCNWFIRFQVVGKPAYLRRIDKSFRKGELFVPIELHQEDEEHAQRLQDLGYF